VASAAFGKCDELIRWPVCEALDDGTRSVLGLRLCTSTCPLLRFAILSR